MHGESESHMLQRAGDQTPVVVHVVGQAFFLEVAELLRDADRPLVPNVIADGGDEQRLIEPAQAITASHLSITSRLTIPRSTRFSYAAIEGASLRTSSSATGWSSWPY